MKNYVRLVVLVMTLIASATMWGCGSSGGGTTTVVAGNATVIPGYNLQPGESSLSGSAFLSYSSLSNRTFAWAKQQGTSGTLAFGDKSAGTGTFTSASPAVNAPMTWAVADTVISVNVATTPVTSYLYTQVAVNSSASYFVMLKEQVNGTGGKDFVDFERWYYGSGASAAAQAYAASVATFTSALVSNKKLRNVNLSAPLWSAITDLSPSGVAVDSSGAVYVVNTTANSVQKFVPGTALPVWTGATDPNPLGVAVDAAGEVFVVNSNPNQTGVTTVQKFTTASTLPVGIGTVTGSYPNAIAVDSTGSHIYVTCALSNTVEMLPALTSTTVLPASTVVGNTASTPDGVALDASGAVYASSFAGNSVQKFTAAGGTTAVWSGSTAAGPAGLATDATGVYVACATAGVVQKLNQADGTLAWSAATLAKPTAVAVDGSGHIFVTCSAANTVQAFTTAATTPIWSAATGATPDGVALSATGGVFVVNLGSNTLQEFALTGVTTDYSIFANGTFSFTATNGGAGSGNWVINADGTLTLNYLNPASSTTFTIQAGSSNSTLILNAVNSDGSTLNGLTFTFI